jgi:serine phosphatase RsbU (regulator of sigma subunit)
VVDGRVGPPIGVTARSDYASVTVSLPRKGTLLFYTDGLVERRGEDLDQGLARLVDAVTAGGASAGVGQQLDALLAALLPDRAYDDTAVVGVRWT